MRQSLSEKRTALLAVVLSVLLAVVAVIDQAGRGSLLDHAATAYAQHGKQVSAGSLWVNVRSSDPSGWAVKTPLTVGGVVSSW